MTDRIWGDRDRHTAGSRQPLQIPVKMGQSGSVLLVGFFSHFYPFQERKQIGWVLTYITWQFPQRLPCVDCTSISIGVPVFWRLYSKTPPRTFSFFRWAKSTNAIPQNWNIRHNACRVFSVPDHLMRPSSENVINPVVTPFCVCSLYPWKLP